MKTDSVSVVIPAHNAARFLPEAVASIRAQTMAVTEIVVVDDASTDDTAAIARQAGCRVVTQAAAAGAGAARNRGAEVATGEWLAFLDADDLWVAGKIARQLAWMQTHPETDVLFGHGANFMMTPGGLRREEPVRPAYLPGSALLRRQYFLDRFRFNPLVAPSEVVDWYLRLQREGARLALQPELVLWRRLHDTNTRRQGDGGRATDLKLLRAHLAAKRVSGSGA